MKHIERYQETDRILSEIHDEIHEFLKIFLPLAKHHLIGERRQRPFCRLSLCEHEYFSRLSGNWGGQFQAFLYQGHFARSSKCLSQLGQLFSFY